MSGQCRRPRLPDNRVSKTVSCAPARVIAASLTVGHDKGGLGCVERVAVPSNRRPQVPFGGCVDHCTPSDPKNSCHVVHDVPRPAASPTASEHRGVGRAESLRDGEELSRGGTPRSPYSGGPPCVPPGKRRRSVGSSSGVQISQCLVHAGHREMPIWCWAIFGWGGDPPGRPAGRAVHYRRASHGDMVTT